MMPQRVIVPLWLLLVAFCPVYAAKKDKNDSCPQWAAEGECDKNPGYMKINCATSCKNLEDQLKLVRRQLASIETFFALKAVDIDGNAVDFEQFRGKVTVVVNVASYCGYTESHYRGLVDLWSQLKDESVEILAFPCNQFGAQEPEAADKIKAFAADKGVEFRMMNKINVNGPSADLVYLWLKDQAGVESITWNFATYFVVDPEGHVESYTGVEPLDLKPTIMSLLGKDEL